MRIGVHFNIKLYAYNQKVRVKRDLGYGKRTQWRRGKVNTVHSCTHYYTKDTSKLEAMEVLARCSGRYHKVDTHGNCLYLTKKLKSGFTGRTYRGV